MKKIIFPEEFTEEFRDLPRDLPFRIPEHYFEDFQSRLQARMEKEELYLPEKRFSVIRYLKPALGIAAAIAIVFLLVYYPGRLITQQVAMSGQTDEEQNLINLIERVDDHTFLNLLENENQETKLEGNELEVFIASNYSDFDIYLETQK